MTESSFFARLRQRRVFPIVGMYVAASWLVIELGDWVTERFGLPSAFTTYVFVAMITMLPAVALLAYGHGAPGKDRWTRTEKVFIPLNAVVALLAVYVTSPMLVVEAATETVQIADETGAVQEFEVARLGYHRELIGFFWTNESDDADLDWLSYGLPFMLVHDLNRVSPVLTAVTPMDSESAKTKLERQGYESLVDVPQGLAVEIARDRQSAALVVGSFDSDGTSHVVTATLIDADSGDVLASRTITSDDWFSAVDQVTEVILESLDVVAADNQNDDPVAQHLTDSLEAVRHYTNGNVAIDRDNDYPRGIAELTSAVEVDPAFAEARGILSTTQHLSGDTASARVSASQALRNGYRLSEASKFIIKANRYIFDGEFERGQRVLEMWTEVQPNSTRAYETLAFISRVQGGDEDLAIADAAYDRVLELNPNDSNVWLQKAALEEQRGEYDLAAEYLGRYLDDVPDSNEAYQQLSGVYQRQGKLDLAQEALEDASILSDDSLAAEIGLARLEARRGLFGDAEERIASLREDELNAGQAFQVLGIQSEVAVAQGQISRSIELTKELNEQARAIMPPAIRIVTFEAQVASFTSMLGRTDEALELMDAVAAQLQPPISHYLNFTYTNIHGIADDRPEYRRYAAESKALENQMPEMMRPFIHLEEAQLAVWDGDNETALESLDRAGAALGQSLLRVAQDNLSTSQFYGGIAELYLEAGDRERARAALEDILHVYPSSAFTKLILARVLIAEGDEDGARKYLDEALEVWSAADDDYIHVVEARELRASL